MRIFSTLLLTTVAIGLAGVVPALADDWRRHGDIHEFHDHGFDHWRGGSWYNGFHEGRNGWWWIVDGTWYFYPAPVYPYPDPYTPPLVEAEPGETVVVGAPSYYYCADPAGYYPYVPQCYGHWRRVAAATAAPPTVVVEQQPAPVPAPQQPATGERDSDQRRLNMLADEFKNIDPTGAQAEGRLKEIAAKVESFRQSLFKRDYNAMDILKNAEDLQHRIEAQRTALRHDRAVPGAMPPAASMPAPAPAGSLPPGTTVTFPPQ